MYSRVYVEITNICNRSCSFCPKTKRKPRSLSMDEFTHIARSIAPVTDYLYYHVMGEPLTHQLLPDFIRFSSTLGLKSAVTTNGTLLRERGDQLIESGVYKVNISVHSFESGNAEAHRKYVLDCLDFADKASRSGVLVVLRLWNRGVDKTPNDETRKLIFDKFGEPEQVSIRGARLRKGLHLEYGDRFVWPDLNETDMGDNVFCYGLNDHFGILSDGSVVPCCLDHEGDITLGNIFTDGITEILGCGRAESIRNGFKNKKATEQLCRKCGYARRFKV
ncbi:MAG: radical SAM protein [Clostridia bacterium]|nr:radical SAM protein [Clostridia bacterium]